MAAKRSPILGYNHNVRYRGLVFHVQTEDSGVMSPHLFTHMFHGGVIVSTRKLVYDSGSAEDAIKSLMQAQHKAVLKDLKRGQFDDKIDQYLGGTEGLLPRGAGIEDDRPSTAAMVPLADVAVDPSVDAAIDAAVELEADAVVPVVGAPTIADLRPVLVGAPTIADLGPPMEPPPPMDDLPTALDTGGVVAAAVGRLHSDSMPEIEIQLEVDDDRDDVEAPNVPRRASRDTEVEAFIDLPSGASLSDGVPRTQTGNPTLRATMPGVGPDATERARTTDSIPPVPPPPTDKRIGASSLPPMRQPTRPPSRPAIVAPTVVTRPVTRDGAQRPTGESEPVEVYAPPPSGQDPQPAERPGQYSLRRSTKIAAVPAEVPRRERSGSAGIPSGLARPGPRPASGRSNSVAPGEALPTQPLPSITRSNTPSGSQPAVARPPSGPQPAVTRPPSVPTTVPPQERARPAVSSPPPAARVPTPSPPVPTQPMPRVVTPSAPERPRTQTPAQFTGGRTPTPARVTPPHSRAHSASGSGVVMTRPAVIVGAPAKQQPSRVRKASEEARGFGQGLISEKSLDEVILAYLSEDAEDK